VQQVAPAKPATAKKPVNPHKLEAAEKKVEQLGASLADIDRQLADPANYADAAKMGKLGGEREVLAQQLEQAEAAWMELLGD
jgi:ATP-binding cassette subfamily F protein 3